MMIRAPIDKQDIQRVREAIKAHQTRIDGHGAPGSPPVDKKTDEQSIAPVEAEQKRLAAEVARLAAMHTEQGNGLRIVK